MQRWRDALDFERQRTRLVLWIRPELPEHEEMLVKSRAVIFAAEEALERRETSQFYMSD